ncbi:alpha-L-fucosidase [Paludicola sp. MB14-C6]|uniref:alpha-L-fucosidase n=1 Tax=Paludihabitans sp. MB14-C6 TaxID=3070656 RepID=UPI0027DD9ACC|nr:alpha-L-fucosidase [Paludicola sp. MB14-C6]WMJ22739.1 alpha-L-fucosidase [Paludicola sp. MB14-C6]
MDQYIKRMNERDQRTEWFLNDRFGMFLHWGLYSIHGKNEWYPSDNKVSTKEYQTYFEEFNPVRFNAKEWAKMAKAAGMKYAVLTTKHHDGFCLFDSEFTDFKVTNTPFKRDIIKEFVEAFRAEGLKVGLYYSLLDWHHEEYPAYGDMYHPSRDDEAFKNKNRDFNKYLTYMHNQVEELMTKYGKIDIMWFDFSYKDHLGDDWKGRELISMIRKYQPHIILNGRLEGSGESYGSIMTDEPQEFAGDFACPEMIIPPQGLTTKSGRQIPWEACFTLNNNWGYSPNDKMYKNSSQLIRKLVECTSKNGNMLLNLSPTAKGDFPEIQVKILQEIAEWMKKSSESIYNCKKADLPKPEWGRYTQNGKKLYAHILDESIGAICLPGLKGKVKKARVLSDGSEVVAISPWVAKEFPDDLFINYGLPEWMSFTFEPTPDRVIELELI